MVTTLPKRCAASVGDGESAFVVAVSVLPSDGTHVAVSTCSASKLQLSEGIGGGLGGVLPTVPLGGAATVAGVPWVQDVMHVPHMAALT